MKKKRGRPRAEIKLVSYTVRVTEGQADWLRALGKRAGFTIRLLLAGHIIATLARPAQGAQDAPQTPRGGGVKLQD